MGYLDDDGYLFLTDRRTFMIVSGGVNIYPQEAENLLIDHPKVYDVAVFGIPDVEMGERVHAVVQPVDWNEAGPALEARAARVLPRQPLALQVPEGRRLRARAARASRPASSTSDSCATATGATRPAASSEPMRARERFAGNRSDASREGGRRDDGSPRNRHPAPFASEPGPCWARAIRPARWLPIPRSGTVRGAAASGQRRPPTRPVGMVHG